MPLPRSATQRSLPSDDHASSSSSSIAEFVGSCPVGVFSEIVWPPSMRPCSFSSAGVGVMASLVLLLNVPSSFLMLSWMPLPNCPAAFSSSPSFPLHLPRGEDGSEVEGTSLMTVTSTYNLILRQRQENSLCETHVRARNLPLDNTMIPFPPFSKCLRE